MNKRYLRATGYVVFYVLTAIAVAATLIPLFPAKEWYVQIFDYPRLQTFIVAALALLWYGIFYFRKGKRGYLVILLLVAVLVVQGYKAWPYTPLGAKQVLWSEREARDSTSLSLFICNVLQTNTAYSKVHERIRAYNPDIVITTETDSIWQQALVSIEKEYPYRVPVPLSNTYGMHLYSRFPLREARVRYLIEPDIPSIRAGVKLPSGDWITLFVVHPRPPVPGEASDTRERDAEIILVARESRKETGGVIVAGDFNDVAWSENSELFQKVSGFLDPRRGRGFYNTFHAGFPIFRWPLDHIFHSPHFKLLAMDRADDVNSDHFPMYVRLSYEPKEVKDQPAVKPNADTEIKAKKTIQEGKQDKDAPGQ